jgi:hypothetical protein
MRVVNGAGGQPVAGDGALDELSLVLGLTLPGYGRRSTKTKSGEVDGCGENGSPIGVASHATLHWQFTFPCRVFPSRSFSMTYATVAKRMVPRSVRLWDDAFACDRPAKPFRRAF